MRELKDNLNTGKVRRKANRTPTFFDYVLREKKPIEVVYRLTGWTKSLNHISEHINYLCRNGKIELEDDKGQTLIGKERYEIIKEWKYDNSEYAPDQLGRNTKSPSRNRRMTVSMVFSMPKGTPPEAVQNAVRDLAKEMFGDKHKYVMALHTDTNSPHVHLCVSTKPLEEQQKRLHISMEDTNTLRAKFAEKMREQGIDADATPRKIRGVVKRPEHIALIKQRKRFKKLGKYLDIDLKALEEAKKERSGDLHKDRPWEDVIMSRQITIKMDFMESYIEFLKKGQFEDAKKLRVYMEKKEWVKTKHQELIDKLELKQIQKNAERNMKFFQRIEAIKNRLLKKETPVVDANKVAVDADKVAVDADNAVVDTDKAVIDVGKIEINTDKPSVDADKPSVDVDKAEVKTDKGVKLDKGGREM